MANSAHGGFDGGAMAPDGTSEKDINLSIAKKLKDFLQYMGFRVLMTREDDVSTETNNEENNKKLSDLKNRIALMSENKDSIFVSIHLNKFTTTKAVGAQVFYSKNSEDSELLAECIQTSLVSHIQPDNQRKIKKSNNSIFLLKKSYIPSIIIECGFLSNYEELTLLKDDTYQSKIAFSIYCGLLKYFS